MSTLDTVFHRLAAWAAERDWVGPDPYEGLNTPAARLAPGMRSRQVVTQLYKRLPFSPPWPLTARPLANSKVLGLVLSAYSSTAGDRLEAAERARVDLMEGLSSLRVEEAGSWGWSYPFDAQTRHLLFRQTQPNAVATSFAVAGLLDLYDHAGEDKALELALGSRGFLTSLMQRDHAAGPFFAYASGATHLIHNASLLVCAALARMSRHDPDGGTEAMIREATATTLAAQDDAGLWPYGDAANLGWADNFHTAYVLEALVSISDTVGLGDEALSRGLRVWRAEFFDGADALLYPSQPYPLEAHSYASAIDLCCIAAARDPDLLGFAQAIAARAVERLWLPDEGRFAYRVSRLGTNRREFMRWTNAPMLRALARLLSVERPPAP